MQINTSKAWLIWIIGVSFLLFQFFLQLSSGIVIGTIMQERALSAFTAGLLSSSFYYVYTSLQMPVGFLFDKYNARILLASNAAICALGCFIFALINSLPSLFLGRIIMGTGSAFAFVGLAHIVRMQFPLRNYAFMIGLSETLGFIVTVLGMIVLGWTISHCGWRGFIIVAGILGLVIAALLWKFIPDTQTNRVESQGSIKYQNVLLILKNKLAWVNGMFVCLEFSVITVFAALWAVPFLQVKLDCSIKVSSFLASMLFLGTALSCPLFGQLSILLSKRKRLMRLSCLLTAVLMILVLYLPTHNHTLIALLMFGIGLSCGAYMLTYTIANELAPAQALSTCTGFTNTLAMLSAPILQPLVGFLLDTSADTPGVYTLWDYQLVLLIIPALLLIAAFLVRYLPEKPSL